MGCPPAVRLVEMGPGKGTLMKDLLRAARSFPRFREALTVHMVETSPFLRQKQREAVGALPLPPAAPAGAGGGTGGSAGGGGAIGAAAAAGGEREGGEAMHMRLPGGGEVHWHSLLAEVPEGPLLFVGQVGSSLAP